MKPAIGRIRPSNTSLRDRAAGRCSLPSPMQASDDLFLYLENQKQHHADADCDRAIDDRYRPRSKKHVRDRSIGEPELQSDDASERRETASVPTTPRQVGDGVRRYLALNR